MTNKEFLEYARKVANEIVDLMETKNADYTANGGPFDNFTKSADFWNMEPLRGLMLREMDKTMRIKSYLETGELRVENEGLKDAFRDKIGYSLLALGILENAKTVHNKDTK